MSSEVKDTWSNLHWLVLWLGQVASPFQASVSLLRWGIIALTHRTVLKIYKIIYAKHSAWHMAIIQYWLLISKHAKLFFIRDYKDLRKSKPECYCKQIKTRVINFRWDNRKHPPCQRNSFSFCNNAIHPKDGFSFPET